VNVLLKLFGRPVELSQRVTDGLGNEKHVIDR
jgi:hypothetical protein